jgi:hypothetical protein
MTSTGQAKGEITKETSQQALKMDLPNARMSPPSLIITHQTPAIERASRGKTSTRISRSLGQCHPTQTYSHQWITQAQLATKCPMVEAVPLDKMISLNLKSTTNFSRRCLKWISMHIISQIETARICLQINSSRPLRLTTQLLQAALPRTWHPLMW